MTQVKFSVMDEFFRELEQDAGDGSVESRIVRVTLSWRLYHPINVICVLATYQARGAVVKCEERVGDYIMAEGPDGLDAKRNADAAVNRVRARVKQLGLQVRDGMFD